MSSGTRLGGATPTVSSTQRRADPAENRRRSRKQEVWVAKGIEGVVVAGSGAFDRPGDTRSRVYLTECKTTGDRSFRVTLETLAKLTEEADAENLTPMLAIRFEDAPEGVEPDWFAVPARVFIALNQKRGT